LHQNGPPEDNVCPFRVFAPDDPARVGGTAHVGPSPGQAGHDCDHDGHGDRDPVRPTGIMVPARGTTITSDGTVRVGAVRQTRTPSSA
jgi:hypothetical protein